MAIDDVSVDDGECEGEGVQAVVVQFNSTSVEKEGKQFARNMRRLRLSRIPNSVLKKKKGAAKDNDTGE